MPAAAGVCRTICEDQGRHQADALRPWRIPAAAVRRACAPFFELSLTRWPNCAVAPHPRARRSRASDIAGAAASSAPASCRVGQSRQTRCPSRTAVWRAGASAGRAEKRCCGGGLTRPAAAGVCRTICEDQGRHQADALRPWRIPAAAVRSACAPFFELSLMRWPNCAVAPHRRARRSRASGIAGAAASSAPASCRVGQSRQTRCSPRAAVWRAGASAGRAEKRCSGGGLTMPAAAGVCRAICEDQGRRQADPLRQWRIPAAAVRSACAPFFDLSLTRWPNCAGAPHHRARRSRASDVVASRRRLRRQRRAAPVRAVRRGARPARRCGAPAPRPDARKNGAPAVDARRCRP